MDLLTADQDNGKLWHRAKNGAFLCFTVACALLAVSLVLAPPPDTNGDRALATSFAPRH